MRRKFYNGGAWRKVSKAYMEKVFFLCERCSEPARLVHHKKKLTDSNINDFSLAYGFDNLEALCLDCHNKEHFRSKRAAGAREDRYSVDECGRIMPPSENKKGNFL